MIVTFRLLNQTLGRILGLAHLAVNLQESNRSEKYPDRRISMQPAMDEGTNSNGNLSKDKCLLQTSAIASAPSSKLASEQPHSPGPDAWPKTRLRFSHTATTAATPDRLWQVWVDVDHWARWDTELEWAALPGAFGLGAQGRVKPKSGPVCPFTITEFSPNQSYSFTTRLLFCDLVERRTVRRTADTTYFTHDVAFTGGLAGLFGLWLSQRFQTVLPEIMDRLKAIAETAAVGAAVDASGDSAGNESSACLRAALAEQQRPQRLAVSSKNVRKA